MTAEAMSTDQTAWVHDRCAALIRNVESFIHGQSEVVTNAVICLLAEGHILIEGNPGLAKTSLAKAIAYSVGGSMKRIQFTPDLLPSDVTGVQIYDPGKLDFEFREGPVFANIVLGDEINRTSPKTQSALLEAMAERQVTVGGESHPLPRPNIVIATQNPIELQGTYALPEAQLDRFMMQLKVGYPGRENEKLIVHEAITRWLPERLDAVLSVKDLEEMIEIAGSVYMAEEIGGYIVDIVTQTRTKKGLRLGASPRASNALAVASQAQAACKGRSFVTPDDVKAMVQPVLCHRLVLTPEAAINGHSAQRIVHDIMGAMAVPRDPVGGWGKGAY